MIFIQQGMVAAQILGNLVGFGIGIVASAILQAWFYERTRSVFVSIFIHAIFNTLPLTAALLFRDSPAVVIAQLARTVAREDVAAIFVETVASDDLAETLANSSCDVRGTR
jgi:hypothetical protein